MPISVTCSACGQRLKAKDSLAGRMVPCPKCGEKLLIPQADEDVAAYLLQSETSPDPEESPAGYSVQTESPPEPPHPPAAAEPEVNKEEEEPRPSRAKRAPIDVASLPPLSAKEPPLWLRHLHWLLVLALIPLALSLLQAGAREDIQSRLEETLEDATPEQQIRLSHLIEEINEGKRKFEELFPALPEQKLAGALLPRRSWTHWAFAGGSAVLFMTFFLLLSTHQTAEPLRLLAIGLFTATIGIAVLLLFQVLADVSQGIWLRGGHILVLLLYIVKLIGFSYRAALDPETGFFLSFLGYTLGVGLCEEVVKALPLLWHYRRPSDQGWRGAFLWGLASGAGFGISEGIMYSSSYYNGISGSGIYIVRFISCVALHALWTGSVGITLNQKQELIQQDLTWYEYIPPLFLIVGVPMVLHGLYDTLLKKEMNAWALVVAVLSFMFLAFQISRLHGEDDVKATKAMFREYKRRRKAMG